MKPQNSLFQSSVISTCNIYAVAISIIDPLLINVGPFTRQNYLRTNSSILRLFNIEFAVYLWTKEFFQ